MTNSKIQQYDLKSQAYTLTGWPNNYALVVPKLDALYDEMNITVEFNQQNATGQCYLSTNSWPLYPILRSDGSATQAWDLVTTWRYQLTYNVGNTSWILGEKVDSEIEGIINNSAWIIFVSQEYVDCPTPWDIITHNLWVTQDDVLKWRYTIKFTGTWGWLWITQAIWWAQWQERNWWSTDNPSSWYSNWQLNIVKIFLSTWLSIWDIHNCRIVIYKNR